MKRTETPISRLRQSFFSCHPERARIERSETNASRRTLRFSPPEETNLSARMTPPWKPRTLVRGSTGGFSPWLGWNKKGGPLGRLFSARTKLQLRLWRVLRHRRILRVLLRRSRLPRRGLRVYAALPGHGLRLRCALSARLPVQRAHRNVIHHP